MLPLEVPLWLFLHCRLLLLFLPRAQLLVQLQ